MSPEALPDAEKARIAHLLELLPPSLGVALEVGARDGRVTAALAPRASRLVALDLRPPEIRFAGALPVGGDASALPFRDAAFDTVVCTEVLEHIPPPALDAACAELSRVTAVRLLVTVPFEQDLGVGATRCPRCGTVNPPWGHVNSFTTASLLARFPGLRAATVATFGAQRNVQPALAARMERALGYPHGNWNQEEPCVACGARLVAPARSRAARGLALAPLVLTKIARAITRDRPSWIEVVFER
jgi:hypothetical protein